MVTALGTTFDGKWKSSENAWQGAGLPESRWQMAQSENGFMTAWHYLNQICSGAKMYMARSLLPKSNGKMVQRVFMILSYLAIGITW